MENLLVVIDMQKVFMGSEWQVPEIRKAEKHILELLPHFEDAVFTQHVTAKQPRGTWKRYNEAWGYLDEDPANIEILDRLKPYARELLVGETVGVELEHIQAFAVQ